MEAGTGTGDRNDLFGFVFEQKIFQLGGVGVRAVVGGWVGWRKQLLVCMP